MEYEGQICRAPMERSAFMLPVSVGCAYNRCKFCTLFKHLQYRVLPPEQVEAELRRVHDVGGAPKTVFFGDGSAFQLSFDHLMQLLELVHRWLPQTQRIHMDATVPSIAEKSDAQLQALYDGGVRRLYIGIETGLDDVLAFMDKDHDNAQAAEQIRRIQAVGMEYAAHIMTGIAGAGRGAENAAATAAFLNATHPCSVTNFSLFLHNRSPLQRHMEDGSFTPADELENLKEARKLIALLDTPLVIDSFHDILLQRVRGTLPRDREKLLAKLDGIIAARQEQPPVYAFVE